MRVQEHTALLSIPRVDLRDAEAVAKWEALQEKVSQLRPRDRPQFDVQTISRRQAG